MNYLENITFRRTRHRTNSDPAPDDNDSTSQIIECTASSMPDISVDEDYDQVRELKEEIQKLVSQLDSAHKEIDILNLEISKLRFTNEDLIKKNQLYKKVTTISPIKTNQSTPKRKPLRNGKTVHTQTDIQLCIPNTQQRFVEQFGTNKPPSEVSNLPDMEANVVYNVLPLHAATEGTTITERAMGPHKQFQHKLISDKTCFNKVCIISDNNVNNILRIAKNTFPNANICHYCMPNVGAAELLSSLDKKLEDFTLYDYCIILLGEKDFFESQNYENLVNHIKGKIETVMHTNVIICSPNFKLKWNVNLFNTRIEAFNRLMYLSNRTFKYAYLFDTNKHLEYNYKMFSKYTGKVNNRAIVNIFQNLNSYIQLLINTEYENNCDSLKIVNTYENSKIDQLQPGTIPYYFEKKKMLDRDTFFRR